MSMVDNMVSMFKREIAKRKIDNLISQLEEEERVAEFHLEKGLINRQTAAQYYRSAYNIGLKQLKMIDEKYNLKELGIDCTIVNLSLKQLKRKGNKLDNSLSV